MEHLIDIYDYPIKDVLKTLLLNKSTKDGNIIWASSNISAFGEWYSPTAPLCPENLDICDLRPRVLKNNHEQKGRAKKHAEVFTPAWICNKMINLFDDSWFCRTNVFNIVDKENEEHWVETDKVEFSDEKGKTWKDYVDIACLEMTCGEAPFLVSRYDASTGQVIPIKKRIGILDRKIRVINENTPEITKENWVKWVIRAFENTYGYEYQGDNLLVGRINLLLTFVDYYVDRWGEKPSVKELRSIAHKICWNLFQMDGFTYQVPYNEVTCEIQDWRSKLKVEVKTMDRKIPDGSKKEVKKKFRPGVVICNPPYQSDGNNLQQVYPKFYTEAIKVADAVCMVFPSSWQEPKNGSGLGVMNKPEIKEDEHIVCIHNLEDVFKGYDGAKKVNIIYWNRNHHNNLGGKQRIITNGKEEIKRLLCDPNDVEKPVPIVELERLVVSRRDFIGADSITSVLKPYGLRTDVIEHPEKYGLPTIYEERQDESDLVIWHRDKGKIKKGYLNKEYPIPKKGDSFNKYKVLIGKTWGNMSENYLGGAYSDILIAGPTEVCTEKFLLSGSFDTFDEAQKHAKYIMTTFCRALLFRNKNIQDNSKDKWRSVPVQDYSETWWSKSIDEIDEELFKKYNVPTEIMEYVVKNVQRRTEQNIINF